MFSPTVILVAFLAGILPALLWLWFWLKEDGAHPEPRRLLIYTFIAGMVCVPLVLPFEHYAREWLSGVFVIIAWAAIEELFKYGAMYAVDRKRAAFDEPMDPVVYMITVALGFAALENAFFLLDPLSNGNLNHTILTGNLRFLGASLLHVLSSATIGVAMALSFYKPPAIQRKYILAGVILAIVLHTLFNFFIIQSNGTETLSVFTAVWGGIIILLLTLERVKRIRAPRSRVPYPNNG